MYWINWATMGSDSLFLCTKDCHTPGIFLKVEILDWKHLESLKPVCYFFEGEVKLFYSSMELLCPGKWRVEEQW